MNAARGRFITFEGVDSAGKGTQIRLLEEWLSAKQVRHVVTFEPGGTFLGKAVRELLLAPNSEVADPLVELLLFLAARKHHVASLIEPALGEGKWVVCDRFSDSTYAYQGGGGGIAPALIAALSEKAGITLEPDLTFLLDLPADDGGKRRRERNARKLPAASRRKKPLSDQGLLWEDKFESQTEQYFNAVRQAYLKQAEESKGRIQRIDARGPVEQVQEQIRKCIATRFGID